MTVIDFLIHIFGVSNVTKSKNSLLSLCIYSAHKLESNTFYYKK